MCLGNNRLLGSGDGCDLGNGGPGPCGAGGRLPAPLPLPLTGARWGQFWNVKNSGAQRQRAGWASCPTPGHNPPAGAPHISPGGKRPSKYPGRGIVHAMTLSSSPSGAGSWGGAGLGRPVGDSGEGEALPAGPTPVSTRSPSSR